MAREARRIQLTQEIVNRLNLAEEAPAGGTDCFVWDAEVPGFGVRLRPSKRVYVAQYRVGRRQRRESLGDVRKLLLKDARAAARRRFAQVVLGIDPGAEKAADRRRQSALFRDVVDRYLEAKRPVLRGNTWAAAARYFRTYWQGFNTLRVDEIDQRTVAAELAKLLKERGRTAVARARANLSALFGWAMREGLVAANPVIATNDPSAGIASRDRVLSDDELRAIWAACEADDFGRIVKLLLLTACRRDEIGDLRWSEIQDQGISLPAERTKAKRRHLVPLSKPATAIIGECPQRFGREFVFGSRGAGFSRWSWEKLTIDKRLLEAGQQIAPWRIHDLRRTAATRMARFSPPHVVEAVLNHTLGSKVQQTYNRYTYEPEKRAALEQWAEEIEGILSTNRIVTLRLTA